MKINLEKYNNYLKNKSPFEIINWALSYANKPILTTNFGPNSASLIHAITEVKPNIDIIWCDTGYNTTETYRFAQNLIQKKALNMHVYVPRQTTAYRNITLGIPNIDTLEHELFTEEVKLEPFNRALEEHKPDVWFTNLRKSQNEFRNNLNILSLNKDGILKVCPFFYFLDSDIAKYLNENKLPNELHYFDPTKVLSKRECGLHL